MTDKNRKAVSKFFPISAVESSPCHQKTTSQVWLCKTCGVERQMWMKTGAWFFKVSWISLATDDGNPYTDSYILFPFLCMLIGWTFSGPGREIQHPKDHCDHAQWPKGRSRNGYLDPGQEVAEPSHSPKPHTNPQAADDNPTIHSFW